MRATPDEFAGIVFPGEARVRASTASATFSIRKLATEMAFDFLYMLEKCNLSTFFLFFFFFSFPKFSIRTAVKKRRTLSAGSSHHRHRQCRNDDDDDATHEKTNRVEILYSKLALDNGIISRIPSTGRGITTTEKKKRREKRVISAQQ